MGGWTPDSTGPLQRTGGRFHQARRRLYTLSPPVTAVDAGNFPRDFPGRNELDYTHSLIGGETWSTRQRDVSGAAY